MIAGYIGGMGSGKTISTVRQVYHYYKKGYKIYSNMHLNFPHEKITLTELLKYSNMDKPFYNTVILLDEIHIFIDSRRSMSEKNVLISYFVTQTRKQKVKLFFTTQYLNQVDKRLRSNSSLLVNCRKKCVWRHPEDEDKDIYIIFNDVHTIALTNTHVFIANRYYDLYDTEEIISI